MRGPEHYHWLASPRLTGLSARIDLISALEFVNAQDCFKGAEDDYHQIHKDRYCRLGCAMRARRPCGGLSDIFIMIAVGIAALWLEKNDFPVAPIILGLVLGPLLEQNLTTSLAIAGGELVGFLERPVSAMLAGAAALMWAIGLISGWRMGRQNARG